MALPATLVRTCGNGSIPGTGSRFYMIQKGDITTFASNSASTTPTERKTFDTAFTLASGKRWTEVDGLVNTGDVIDSLQGEVGGQFIRNSFVIFIDNYDAAGRDFADELLANSGCLIFLVPSKKTGEVNIVGNLNNPCFVEQLTGGVGGVETTRRGIALRVYADTGYTCPIHTATIDVTA
jgi:hypothetical protein